MDAIRKLLANVIAPGDDWLVAEARSIGGIPNSGDAKEEGRCNRDERGRGRKANVRVQMIR
jgi:hypothetical protein